MILVTPHLLAIPLTLMAWALDSYLFISLFRLLLGLSVRGAASEFCRHLRYLTDTPPRIVDKWLALYARTNPAPWLPWAIVMTAGFMVRQILVSMMTLAS